MILLRFAARVFRRRSILALLVPLLVSAVALPATADQASDPDVPVIHNPAVPAGGVEVVHLEEMWLFKHKAADEIFGRIFRADADEDGAGDVCDPCVLDPPDDSDADGQTLTVTGASAGNGTVTVNTNGTLSYSPSVNFMMLSFTKQVTLRRLRRRAYSKA